MQTSRSPRSADARSMLRLGAELFRRRRLEDCLAAYAAARRLGADPGAMAQDCWMACMLLGRYAAAWRISDEVLAGQDPAMRNSPSQPFHLRFVWDGTPLRGRDVLVRCYHGLGDSIQFLRYLPLLRAEARRVSVQAQPELLELLQMSAIAPLVPLGYHLPDPDFEVDIESMELAHAFRTEADEVPAPIPYLRVAPALAEAAAARLGPRRQARIGLVWAAGDWDRRRSLPLAAFDALAGLPGIDWFPLQAGPAAAEASRSRLGLAPPPITGDSLAETAAAMLNLDLVISVDTMAAHLAGALGVPVWTLLHHAADWRWGLGPRTPWYPGMRLFRQPAPGDWPAVLGEVRAALAAAWPAAPVAELKLARS